MAEHQGDRTEKPSSRRLQDARKKGRVARSRSANDAAALAATVLVLSWFGARMVQQLGGMLTQSLARYGESPLRDVQPGELTALAVWGAEQLVIFVAPLAVAVAAAVVLIQFVQGGWVFAPESLTINLAKLSPSSGLQRLKPSAGGFEMLKGLVSVGVVGWLAWDVMSGLIGDASRLGRMPIVPAALIGWASAEQLLRQSVIALVMVAGADYAMQRHTFMQSMKMTKQEVKEENKMTEGSPEIKARVRRVQREMVRRRMLAATRTATVVITNPTHFAVALDYRRDVMPAPRVVAKGQDLLAQRIREIAREHGVPIVENKPLAQALYRTAEVGDLIPGDLFEAVAEVLAYLIRLKQLVL
ncbi:MAG: flagellar biosynthesis protein FlhB [Acidobacteriota bacterium]|nr:flagellar biosynthesis protein FlhB [Acidobacteriota bacterium]